MLFACLEMLDESALKHSFPSSDLQMNHMGSLLKAQTFRGSNAVTPGLGLRICFLMIS